MRLKNVIIYFVIVTLGSNLYGQECRILIHHNGLEVTRNRVPTIVVASISDSSEFSDHDLVNYVKKSEFEELKTFLSVYQDTSFDYRYFGSLKFTLESSTFVNTLGQINRKETSLAFIDDLILHVKSNIINPSQLLKDIQELRDSIAHVKERSGCHSDLSLLFAEEAITELKSKAVSKSIGDSLTFLTDFESSYDLENGTRDSVWSIGDSLLIKYVIKPGCPDFAESCYVLFDKIYQTYDWIGLGYDPRLLNDVKCIEELLPYVSRQNIDNLKFRIYGLNSRPTWVFFILDKGSRKPVVLDAISGKNLTVKVEYLQD